MILRASFLHVTEYTKGFVANIHLADKRGLYIRIELICSYCLMNWLDTFVPKGIDGTCQN